jgi:RAP domain/FAST kinase-like protein, subdomain 2
MVFSKSILNTAVSSCHHQIRHHTGGNDNRRLLSPRLQPYVSTARTDWQCCTGSGWLGSLQFPHVDRTIPPRRSFASTSQSNIDQSRKAKQDGERSGKQHKELGLTVSDTLDDYMQNHEELEPYQVAATWNKIGKAVQKSRKAEQRQSFWIDHNAILQTLVDKTIQSADQFNGRSIATVTHSLVKVLHLTKSKKSLDGELLSLWNTLLHQTMLCIQSGSFNAQSLSNLIWAYGKAANGIMKVPVDSRLLDALADKAELCVDDFVPQGLSNVAWGFATMNHKAPSLFDAISDAAQASMDDFNPQTLSNSAWAFATLKHEAPLLFDAIASAAPACIGNFTPQALSNTAWAFATLKHEAPALLDAIARAVPVQIQDFKPQELSSTAWSFATLNHEAPTLLDAIANFSQVRINDFSPQNLANTAWSFATLNHKAPLLFDAIARVASVRIEHFNSQELSNTAWAFAAMNHEAPLLFDAIARAAPVRIGDFTPQGLANVAWGFATLNHKAPLLFHAIADAARCCIHDFDSQNFSNSAWAFATMNHEAPSLFESIARAARVRIHDFNPQHLSNTAWAFATLNHKAPLLFDAIARAAPVCIGDFTPQGLANLAWSFALFSIEPDSFIPADSPFAQKLLSMDASILSVDTLCQLHQFHLWCKERHGPSWFPDELSQRCWEAFVSTKTEQSRLQNDVVEALQTVRGVSHVEVEVSTDSGYSLDAVVGFQGNRVGVEVDGPFHFLGQSQSPNGATVLKHRQLRALESWKLISVPYWEWGEIGKEGSIKERKNEKQQYLQKLLDGALVVPK